MIVKEELECKVSLLASTEHLFHRIHSLVAFLHLYDYNSGYVLANESLLIITRIQGLKYYQCLDYQWKPVWITLELQNWLQLSKSRWKNQRHCY